MNAYEFTRFDADYTYKARAYACETSVVALQIELAHKDCDAREQVHYTECKDVFIELTMSCNKQEAIKWMKYWMANALAYGIKTKNVDWQYKFLAAYDLFNSLTSNK